MQTRLLDPAQNPPRPQASQFLNATTQRCRAASYVTGFRGPADLRPKPRPDSARYPFWGAEASLRLCVFALKTEGRRARGFATLDDPVPFTQVDHPILPDAELLVRPARHWPRTRPASALHASGIGPARVRQGPASIRRCKEGRPSVGRLSTRGRPRPSLPADGPFPDLFLVVDSCYVLIMPTAVVHRSVPLQWRRSIGKTDRSLLSDRRDFYFPANFGTSELGRSLEADAAPAKKAVRNWRISLGFGPPIAISR
jgi:hypothetical protein